MRHGVIKNRIHLFKTASVLFAYYQTDVGVHPTIILERLRQFFLFGFYEGIDERVIIFPNLQQFAIFFLSTHVQLRTNTMFILYSAD